MRTINLTILSTFILFSCGNSSNQPAENNLNAADGSEIILTQNEAGQQQNPDQKQNARHDWEQLVMKQVRNSKGQVTSEMPFPSTWNIASSHAPDQPYITGPGGIKVIDFPLQTFMYTNDPYMQQAYYQSGVNMRYLPEISQLIQQDIAPWANSQGYQFVKQYEIPEVAASDKWYNDQLYKAMPARTDIKAIGTEWKKADGTPLFILMRLFVITDASMQTWYYMSSRLHAQKEHFEKAKKQLVFSIANTRYALEPIMEYNRQEAQKAGQSWAAHNQRMAQNQASFEASQRAFINSRNATNDAIMSGWKERNASSDRSHQQYIDGIREETNVVNQSTGEQYKVNSGYNNYWMNSNGDYISTDQHDYNPNLDNNMNNQNWDKLQEVDY